MQNKHPLQLAVEELQKMPTIDIKGKSYTQVSTRLAVFRKYFPDASISTILVHDDEQRVVIQARITIGDTVISTGFAEEFRGDGWINATSALENAETSSIGRALAGLSLHGNEFASSFEVSNAISQREASTTLSKNSSQDNTIQQSNSIEANIQKMGLGLEPMPDGSISIMGNSYPHIQELKKMGCLWQAQLKRWMLPQVQKRAA